MAAPAKAPAKGAKPAAKGKKYSVRNVFAKEGNKLTAKNKTCPKCGPGMYMAGHKDRVYCGNCHYMEITAKK